tara:strand:+ start:4030 stop:5592 length:1563 start_codon:yes stop_codon:yes gene_type:complete
MKRTKRLNRKKEKTFKKRKKIIKRKKSKSLRKAKMNKSQKTDKKTEPEPELEPEPEPEPELEDTSTYVHLLNESLKKMGISDNNFTGEDNVLERSWRGSGSFLSEGIKQGLLLLENKNDSLDPDCNRVCLANALIVWQILEKVKSSDKLSANEELYLLCLYYLNRGSNQRYNKVLPLEYALSGIENKLEHAKKKYEEKVSNKVQAKKIKKARNYVEKLQNDKDKIEKKYTEHEPQWRNITALEAIGEDDSEGGDIFWWENIKTGDIKKMNKEWSPELWEGKDDKREKIDVCRPVDCQYLFEYWAKKSPQMKKSIEKLCNNIISIYKGLTFMLIKQFAEESIYQYQLESEPTISETEIRLDLDIFSLLDNIDFVLMPDEKLIHEFSEEYGDDINQAKWVYTNLKKKGYEHYTMDRTLVSELDEKSYLVGKLDSSRISDIEYYDDSASDLIELCLGDGAERLVSPMLTRIDLSEKKLSDGTEIFDINEHFTNNITNHWFIADKDFISDSVDLEISTYQAMYM